VPSSSPLVWPWNNGRLDSTLSTERRASSGAASARQLTGILASDHGAVKDPITTLTTLTTR
jgi:hypothetical protein